MGSGYAGDATPTPRLSQVSPRTTCVLCGRSLFGTTFYETDLGERYCGRHGAPTRCRYCPRLLTLSRATAGASGAVEAACDACVASKVSDQAAVRLVLPPVKSTLRRLGIELRTPVRVRIVTEAEMVASAGGNVVGLTTTEATCAPRVSRKVLDLVIIEGLPALHFGSVVAHEATHAWAAQEGFAAMERSLSEGLCEFAAYAWLKHQGTPEAKWLRASMLASNDPIYGEGLRKVRSSAEIYGVRATIVSLSRTGALPV